MLSLRSLFFVILASRFMKVTIEPIISVLFIWALVERNFPKTWRPVLFDLKGLVSWQLIHILFLPSVISIPVDLSLCPFCSSNSLAFEILLTIPLRKGILPFSFIFGRSESRESQSALLPWTSFESNAEIASPFLHPYEYAKSIVAFSGV